VDLDPQPLSLFKVLISAHTHVGESFVPAYLVDVETSEQFPVKLPVCKVGAAASNNVVIDAAHVEREHVKLEFKANEFYASLLPGATATRKFLVFFDIPTAAVNGRVLQSRPLKVADGDKLQVGARMFQIRIVS